MKRYLITLSSQNYDELSNFINMYNGELFSEDKNQDNEEYRVSAFFQEESYEKINVKFRKSNADSDFPLEFIDDPKALKINYLEVIDPVVIQNRVHKRNRYEN